MRLYCVIVLVVGLAFTAIADGTNVAASISRQYDHALADKIGDHWFKYMDVPVKTPPPVGKVAVEFRLFPDGHIDSVKVDSSTVDADIVTHCKQAIQDSAPFDSWTKEMSQAYTNHFRIIHYTFYIGIQPKPPNTALEPTPPAP